MSTSSRGNTFRPGEMLAVMVSSFTKIPESLIPTGASRFQAYAGISWTLSASVGHACVERGPERIAISGLTGSVVMEVSSENPELVRTRMPDGSTLSGTIRATIKGLVFDTGDGKAVTISQAGDHLTISLTGFASISFAGLYLRRL